MRSRLRTVVAACVGGVLAGLPALPVGAADLTGPFVEVPPPAIRPVTPIIRPSARTVDDPPYGYGAIGRWVEVRRKDTIVVRRPFEDPLVSEVETDRIIRNYAPEVYEPGLEVITHD